jgi:molybdate transport system ATP-binding protein
VTEPHVLLLDEPMSALDAATRAALRVEFRDLLAGFAGYRLMVTHEPDDARALADRVVVLDDGRIAWQGPVGDYRP